MAPKNAVAKSENATNALATRSRLTEMSGDELLAMLAERQAAGEVQDVQDVTGDFTLIDKAALVGKEFTVIHWQENFSDENGTYDEENVFHPAVFASVYCITPDARKIVFNDGGVGILPVLRNHLNETGQTYGIRAPWGLHCSEYKTKINNQVQSATTYYFATSAPKGSRT